MADNAIERRPVRFPEVRSIVRPAHVDERGSFRRIFSQTEYAADVTDVFVEDNVSISKHRVLRGMHFDFRLSKFVQVLLGEIFDVVVDVRRSSPTFGRWESFSLTADGCEQLYVPPGFAHGFYVLSESAIVSYKQSAPYDRASEGQLRWNDPDVGIAWPFAGDPILSAKDASAQGLEHIP